MPDPRWIGRAGRQRAQRETHSAPYPESKHAVRDLDDSNASVMTVGRPAAIGPARFEKPEYLAGKGIAPAFK
jgi:hypothetical protein